MIHCPNCHGRACDACGQLGMFELPGNAISFCFDAWELIRIADMWRNGTPPYAGGLMEQPAALVDAVRFIWADEDHVKQEKLGQMAFFM